MVELDPQPQRLGEKQPQLALEELVHLQLALEELVYLELEEVVQSTSYFSE